MYDKVVDSWYKLLVSVKSTGSDEVARMSEAVGAEVRASVHVRACVCFGADFGVSPSIYLEVCIGLMCL